MIERASHGDVILLLRSGHARSLLLACLGLAGGALLFAQAPGKSTSGPRVAPNPLPTASDVEKGKKIFDALCAICHFSGSTAKKIGPGMKGLYRRGKFADGKPVDDASLRGWIEKGGQDMPPFKDSIGAVQMRELIAYLRSL